MQFVIFGLIAVSSWYAFIRTFALWLSLLHTLPTCYSTRMCIIPDHALRCSTTSALISSVPGLWVWVCVCIRVASMLVSCDRSQSHISQWRNPNVCLPSKADGQSSISGTLSFCLIITVLILQISNLLSHDYAAVIIKSNQIYMTTQIKAK